LPRTMNQASCSSTDQGAGNGARSPLWQNAPPAAPEAAQGLLRALVVLAQQLSSSTSRAFVASPAHHFW
jgi:hypothetical protein